MSRLPIASDVRRAQPQPLPNLTISDDAAGVNVAKATSRAGNALVDTANQLREEEQKTEAQDAANSLSRIALNLEFGDGTDENPGFNSLSAREKIARREEFEEKLELERERLTEGLSAGAARRFKRTSDARLLQSSRMFASGALQAQKNLEVQVLDEAQDAAQDTAVANSLNFRSDEFRGSVRAARDAALKSSMKKFGDGKLAAKAGEDAVTKLHIAVINDLLERDPSQARAFFDEHRSEIDKNEHAALENAISKGRLLQQSQQKTDEIAAEFDLSSTSGREAALVSARKIKDAELRQDVVKAVKARISEATALIAARDRELREEAFRIAIDDGHTRNVTPAMRAAFKSTASLENEAQRAKLRQLGVENTAHQPTAWAEFTDLTNKEVLEMGAAGIYEAYGSKFDGPHLDRALSRFRALKSAEEAGKMIPNGAGTLSQQLSAAANAMQLTGKSKAEEKGRFYSQVQQIVNDQEIELDRRLTFDERQKVIDRQMLQGRVFAPGAFFDTDKARFEINPDEKFDMDADDVFDQRFELSGLTGATPDTVVRIGILLRKANLPVNVDTVRDFVERAKERRRQEGK